MKVLRISTAAAIVGAHLLLAPFAASAAAPDKSGLDSSASNGGDNGWGNCGYNSSGGNSHTALDNGGKNSGNGGFQKGSTCTRSKSSDPEPPPFQGGGSTGPTAT